ncbi:MAG TPA: prepilin-type N-terminal cleavage/methylation domain-containing protein [Burkholderiales bacterium]|nr:prepilin-type N-terminal cleavage/methylation domain-containing protein [Burkholderiales bacterium]
MSASTARTGSTRGFTLIELVIVMAILGTLLSIAVPRYFHSVERSKEAALKQDLSVMRDAIDKYYGDRGQYPDTLDELVTRHYLRKLPADPLTDSADSWVLVAPPDSTIKGSVYDVRSGASGQALDGSAYSEW